MFLDISDFFIRVFLFGFYSSASCMSTINTPAFTVFLERGYKLFVFFSIYLQQCWFYLSLRWALLDKSLKKFGHELKKYSNK